MKTVHRPAPGTKRNRVADGSFELASPLNRSRLAPLLSGGLLMVLGALTFVYLAGGDPSRPVVMMARDVERGETLTPDDLVRADIASDATIGVVPWEQAESVLVGQVSAANLPARSLPSPASVVAEPGLPQGSRAVGMVLTAGAVPSNDLGVGDLVDVISLDDAGPTVVAAAVPVQRIVANEGRYFVTLIVAEGDVVAVSAAAGDDIVRLAKVPT